MTRTPALLSALAAALTLVPAASASLTATAGRDNDEGNHRIVIADDDGGNLRTLTDGESAELSPDGARVAVIDYEIVDFQVVATSLKVLPAAGGPPTFTMPAADRSVRWAPDSSKLLVTDYGDARRQRLLLLDPATGAETELVRGRFGGSSLSPDVTKLAYVQLRRSGDITGRGGALKVLDLATGATRTVARHATAPNWGPKAIAFATRSRRRGRFVADIATVWPDGSRRRRLTRIRPTMSFFGLRPLAWSADGRRILTDVVGSDGLWLNTYGVDAVHGGARLIARGIMPTALSRDGRHIIGQNGDVSTTGFRYVKIVRVPWKGGKRRVLLRHAMGASYSG